jgi:hypothetical protein
MTLLAEWYVLVSDFVNFVDFVYLVRTNISHQVSLPEKEISHKVHEVHKVHNQDRFTTSHYFSVSPLANRSKQAKRAGAIQTIAPALLFAVKQTVNLLLEDFGARRITDFKCIC